MYLHQKYRTLFANYGLTTPLRIAHFMAQIEHESHFKAKRESLYYKSVSRLREVFYSPFKGKSDYFVSNYLRSTKRCANYVYANRMGNGDEQSGDGFKFRGRGFIQITGKANYIRLSKDTRIDYLNNPDLLLNEADSMISALWYWNLINGNKYADADDIRTITKKINGGYNGMDDRLKKLRKWKKILGV